MISTLLALCTLAAGATIGASDTNDALDVASRIERRDDGRSILHLAIRNASSAPIDYRAGELPWAAHINRELTLIAIADKHQTIDPLLRIEDAPLGFPRKLAPGEQLAGEIDLDAYYPELKDASPRWMLAACWRFDFAKAFDGQTGEASGCELVRVPEQSHE
jgi:hypothetical protein